MTATQEQFENIKASMPITSNTVLSSHELQSVFLTFPALLVANADGTFDAQEKFEMFSICEQLVADDISENLRPSRIAEIYHVACSLLEQGKSYTDQILTIIKDEISDQPDSKELLLNMILGVAESSEGISDAEQEMINKLTKILELEK